MQHLYDLCLIFNILTNNHIKQTNKQGSTSEIHVNTKSTPFVVGSGTIRLNGTLTIILDSQLMILDGETIEIIRASNIEGKFETIKIQSESECGNGLKTQTIQSSTSLSVLIDVGTRCDVNEGSCLMIISSFILLLNFIIE